MVVFLERLMVAFEEMLSKRLANRNVADGHEAEAARGADSSCLCTMALTLFSLYL